MNNFNRRTAMNYRLYTGLDYKLDQATTETATHRKEARQRIALRRRTAAVRQHNRLIALNMSLTGVLGVAVGVLIMYIV